MGAGCIFYVLTTYHTQWAKNGKICGYCTISSNVVVFEALKQTKLTFFTDLSPLYYHLLNSSHNTYLPSICMYSVTHMDSYRIKLVFWPLFKGLETCPSRFVMGLIVHFIFWKNVQTKWIFEFWPYFQKIPMWKHKKTWKLMIKFQISKCTPRAIIKICSQTYYNQKQRHSKAELL